MDIAKLNIEINSQKARMAKTDLDQLTRSGQGLERGMGSMSRAAAKLAMALAAAFSFQQIISKTSQAVREFANFERQMLRLDAQIRATGRTGQTTAADMERMAQAIDKATLQSAQGVRSAQAILMSFRNVSTEMMERILFVAADVAEVMGQDITSAARQMALALEDPATGLTMLRRTGTTFTKEQQDLIKSLHETGQALEAQSEILKVMESQYGNTARAAAQGLAGSFDLLSRNSTNLKVAIGEQLAPEVDRLLGELNTWLEANEKIIAQDIGGKLSQITREMSKLVPLVRETGALLWNMIDGYTSLPAWAQSVGIISAFLFGKKAVLVIAAISAVIGKIKELNSAYTENFESQLAFLREHKEYLESLNMPTDEVDKKIQALTKTMNALSTSVGKFGTGIGEGQFGSPIIRLADDAAVLNKELTETDKRLKKAAESLKDLQVQAALDNWGFEDLDKQTAAFLQNLDWMKEAQIQNIRDAEQERQDSWQREIEAMNRMVEKEKREYEKLKEDRIRKEKEAAEKIAKEWEKAYERMHGFAADMFYDLFDGQIKGFEDFTDQMINIFKRMLAEMAATAAMTNIFKPLMQQMAGTAAGNMFGLPSSPLSGGFPSFNGLSGLPGMGWLGSAIPGTATIGAELGWGASAAQNIGTMASPGVTWGSALGAGAIGSLGYSTIGGAMGLPQSQYSGITAGLGAAGMSAYGGSMAAMTGISALGGPIGIAVGAALGGILGGMFGDSDPKPALGIQGGSWGGDKPGLYDSKYFNFKVFEQDLPDSAAMGIRDHFDNYFLQVDATLNGALKESLAKYDAGAVNRGWVYTEGMNADQIIRAISDNVFMGIVDGLKQEALGAGFDAFDTGFFKSIQAEGEDLFATFTRFYAVVENTDDFLDRITHQIDNFGESLVSAYNNVQAISDILSSLNVDAISKTGIISGIDQTVLGFEGLNAVLESLHATTEELSQATSAQNQIIGAQITGLTASTLEQALSSGTGLADLMEKSFQKLAAAQLAEKLAEEYLVVINEIAAQAYKDSGGDIMAVAAALSGIDLSGAVAEINAFMASMNTLSLPAMVASQVGENLSAAQSAYQVAESALIAAFDAEKARISSAHDARIDQLQNNLRVVSESVSEMTRVTNLLSNALNWMKLESDVFRAMEYDRARAVLSSTLASARTGDFSGVADLEDHLDTLTRQGTDSYVDGTDYQRDFWQTYLAIAELGDLAGVQLSVEERMLQSIESQIESANKNHTEQLSALDEQLAALLGIDTSVLSVADAISQFLAAQSNLKAAESAYAAVRADPSFFNEAKYLENKTAQVNQLLSAGDQSVIDIISGYGIDPTKNLTTADIQNAFDQSGFTAQEHYLRYGYDEGIQPFATGGSFVVGGPGGTDNLGLPQMRVSAGEMVNISRPDVFSGLAEEVKALRQEVKDMRVDNQAHSVSLIKSSHRIERNTDRLEEWDVLGIPGERTT